MKIVSALTLGGASIALWLEGFIPSLNLVLLPIFVTGLYTISEVGFPYKTITIAIWFTTLLLGFFIAIYRPSDFNYPLIWQVSSLYEGEKPFSLHANASKALGGYFVIAFLLIQTLRENEKRTLLASIVFTSVVVVLVTLIAHILFNIQWRPKLPNGFLTFSIVNLGITVLTEEAFFRLLVQDYIASFFTNKRVGIIVSLSIATLLFAFAHTAVFSSSLLLYLIAGTGYGVVYLYTQRLSMAIAAHFGVNILHFSLFEYPIPF